MRSTLLLVLLATPASAQAWFESPQILDIGDDHRLRAQGDVDGDGDRDLMLLFGPTTDPDGMVPWLNDGTGSFSPGVEVVFPMDVLISEEAFRVGDVDGDGLADAVVPQAPSPVPGLWFYPATGGGSFGAPIFLPTDGAPLDVQLADAFGDGALDIAVACDVGVGSSVRWFHRDLVAIFTASATVTVPGRVHSLAAYDFDGDGSTDIVASTPEGEAIHPMRTELSGDLTLLPPLVAAGASSDELELAAGDLDGDGDVDGIAAFYDGADFALRLWVLESTGAPTPVVAPVQELTSTFGVSVLFRVDLLDWDGDGDADLATADQRLTVFQNVGGGQFDHGPTTWLGSIIGQGAGGGDLDGDGHPDYTGSSRIKFGNGTWHGVHPGLLGEGIAQKGYRPMDLDGDGDLDLAGLFGEVSVNDGTGRYTYLGSQWPSPPADHHYSAAAGIGDFDGDGLVDFLVGLSEKIGIFGSLEFREMRLLRDDGAGRYVDDGSSATLGVELTGSDTFPTKRDAVDLDLDGDLDLLVSGGAWLNVGSATGFFTESPDLFVHGSPSDAADVDGDGDVDVLSTSGPLLSETSLHLARNGGGLSFTSELLHLSPTGGLAPHSARFLDLDEDGDLDMAIGGTDGAAGRFVRLFENTAGSFGPAVLLESDNFDGAVLAQQDVDGDGVLDLVSSSFQDDSYGVSAIAFRRTTGIAFELRREYVSHPMEHWADADGDGDVDSLGEVVTRSWRHTGPGAGLIRQYGPSTPGTGGIAPILGARGPMRVGSTTAEVRLRRGLSGSAGLLLAGTGETSFVDALPGLIQHVDPIVAVEPFALDGDGRLDAPLAVTPAMAGSRVFLQAVLVDAGVFALLTSTNGLELAFGS